MIQTIYSDDLDDLQQIVICPMCGRIFPVANAVAYAMACAMACPRERDTDGTYVMGATVVHALGCTDVFAVLWDLS